LAVEKGDYMNRRDFIIKTGGAIALAKSASGSAGQKKSQAGQPAFKASAKLDTRLSIEDGKILIETSTLHAVMDKGFFVSLKSKATGEEFIRGVDPSKSAALQLLYRSDETVDVSEADFGSITTRRVSDLAAEIVFHSWDGDGILTVSADPETGDVTVEPSAYSSRPGVRACRWNVAGLRQDLDLAAPFFQGVKLKLDDSLIKDTRWNWPMFWEAGMAVLQSSNGGFWIHCRDERYRYKAIKVGSKQDPYSIGLDSEAYGPVDDSLGAGGIAWRINVFQGDWKVPAGQYRDWLWSAYGLQKEEAGRRPWIHDVRFAVSWCPGNPEILDALSKRLKPEKVLIHFPEWRTDPYDQNYPNFTASENGKAFVRKAAGMGFRIMPHFNSIDMDPSNPVYPRVRDFQYRDIEKKELQGWSWVNGRAIGVPESNESLLRNRDKNVMVKIHPGLAAWRSILGGSILAAAEDMDLETVFIDVTLCTYNLHNCLVEASTPTEGMKRLIAHIGSLGKGLVVGGEGLNEITAQGLSFAQAHLFKSWQNSIDGLERTGGCALNEFLFGKLCRTFGYSGLSGKNADEEMRMAVQVEHGAIPTVTVDSAEEISRPNAAVKKMLDLAAG
jgi:hypothetical protein